MNYSNIVTYICLTGMTILLLCLGIVLWNSGILGNSPGEWEPKTNYTHVVGLSSGNKVVKIYAEVAATEKAQEIGMMFRRSMRDNDGMLFVFNDSQVRNFWMRGTYIPLDIIFIGVGGGIIKIHRNAVPKDETLISSDSPAIAVLEVKGGMTEKWGINAGGSVNTPLLITK